MLREDGLMLVSIDDQEVSNLREMLNEVFGEENSFAALSGRRCYSPPPGTNEAVTSKKTLSSSLKTDRYSSGATVL